MNENLRGERKKGPHNLKGASTEEKKKNATREKP